MPRRPLAVLISDVHYSLSTYEIADKAFRSAIDKAAELEVPLIDCGDLTNDKAILRAEVVNTLLNTAAYAKNRGVGLFLLVGNHSLLNEKSKEHALNFLAPFCYVTDYPRTFAKFNFIPYQSESADFLHALKQFPKGSIVIGHQGTLGGSMGHYIQDSSAFDPDEAKDHTVFLGHYHQHYKLGTTVSVGNPYTLSFGEANDPPKGFLILYSDGSYERVLTNLRKHVKIERTVEDLYGKLDNVRDGDLIWLTVTGNSTEIAALKKKEVGERLFGHLNFKFDKICADGAVSLAAPEKMTDSELLDAVIDAGDDSTFTKAELKALWREVLA